MDIKEALNRIVGQLDLTTEEMQAVMRQIMTGQCTDAQVGAFLMGMRMKSETIDEIVGAVQVMRELADDGEDGGAAQTATSAGPLRAGARRHGIRRAHRPKFACLSCVSLVSSSRSWFSR